MNVTINRLKIIFLGLFVVACAGVWVHQIFWAIPHKRCDQAGAWWDGRTRTCAQPIYIPDITGRRPGETREQASVRRQADAAQLARRARGEDVALAEPAPDPATPPAVQPSRVAPGRHRTSPPARALAWREATNR